MEITAQMSLSLGQARVIMYVLICLKICIKLIRRFGEHTSCLIAYFLKSNNHMT